MKMVLDTNNIEPYINRKTLITGGVNSGKTTRTFGILKMFCNHGYEERIAILDLAPEALRQSILKKAFEGKLVPQDPNDEPASVLLERIRAERASVVAKNASTETGKRRRGKRT